MSLMPFAPFILQPSLRWPAHCLTNAFGVGSSAGLNLRREGLKIFSESSIYGPPHRILQIGEESGVGAIARLLPSVIDEVYNQPRVF
jgi:hypothetical protein